jgi:hypothetical protein
MPSSLFPNYCITATYSGRISWLSLGSSQTIIGKLHESKIPNILITNELWDLRVVKASKVEVYLLKEEMCILRLILVFITFRYCWHNLQHWCCFVCHISEWVIH